MARKPSIRLRHLPSKVSHPEADHYRIIAGKAVPIETVNTGRRRQPAYSFFHVLEAGRVGTHGTLDYDIIHSRTIGLDFDVQSISDKVLKERVSALIERNEPIMGIMGREVPPEYQTKREQPQEEKLNIGKRLWGHAIKIARKKGIKFIYAATDQPNALKSQQDMGMQLLGKRDGFYYLGMFLE